MTRPLTRLAALAAIAALAACTVPPAGSGAGSAPANDPAIVVALPGGEVIDEAALAARLAGADVVVIGELHDNPSHHRFQARLVERLRPAALAFEMIAEAAEPKVAAHIAAGGAPGEIGDVVGWEKTGWPDFALYSPIIEAAPGVPVTGGGVAREALFKAVADGAVAANTHQAMTSVLETPLPSDVRAQAEEEMVASHCGHLDAERAAGMVEAQRLRDASFAAAVLRAREAGQGPVVLIAGSGHARSDVGVPAFLVAVAPDLKVVSVGQTENDSLEPGVVAGRPFDFIRVTPPFDREDPCANFKPRARAGS